MTKLKVDCTTSVKDIVDKIGGLDELETFIQKIKVLPLTEKAVLFKIMLHDSSHGALECINLTGNAVGLLAGPHLSKQDLAKVFEIAMNAYQMNLDND